jgi:hypothetical protein
VNRRPRPLRPSRKRLERSIPQGIQQLLVALVLDLVAVQLAKRLAHHLTFVELGGDGEHHGADGAGDEQCGDDQQRGHVTPRS